MNKRRILNESNIKIILTMIAISWGLGVGVTQVVIKAGVNISSFIFYRFLIGAMVLFLIYRHQMLLSKLNLKHGIIAGMFLFTFFMLQTLGLKYTSVSNTAIYTGTSALITPFLAWMLLKRKLDPQDIIAALILLLAIIVLNGFSLSKMNVGDLIVLTSAVFLSLQVIYISKVSTYDNVISITIIMLFTTAILGLLSSLLSGGLTNLNIVSLVASEFIYLGVITTALAFFVQNNAVRLTSESQISLILSSEAIWGVVFGVIVFHDKFSLNLIIALILMNFALYYSNSKKLD